MLLAPVESSQIVAVGYDPAHSVLAVEFTPRKDGSRSVYLYENVCPRVAAHVLFSKSVGKDFAASIKSQSDKHPYAKVEDPSPYRSAEGEEPEWVRDLRDHVAAESEAWS